MTISEKSRTNVYLDSHIKDEAKKLFKKYGISLSEAINIFLAQSVYNRGIPFEIKLPNEETMKAIEETREGKNLENISLDTLKKI